jgi:glutamine phosphoribosylpyrophosphate amidotransferase
VRRTPSQVGFTAEERRRNVAGAFRVMGARGQASGKRIVVVDDVITTGATADACARTLKRAGAARVDVWRWPAPWNRPPSCYSLASPERRPYLTRQNPETGREAER